MRRASRAGWEAEMLCKKPMLDNVVFDEFDPAVHVSDIDYDPNLPLYRSRSILALSIRLCVCGFRSMTMVLSE